MTATSRVAFLALVSLASTIALPPRVAFAGAPKETPAEVDARARATFEAGRHAYDQGAFAEALRHYETAYLLSKRPELLFNIGRAADSNGQVERAESAYAAYLEVLPSAENRKFVEARLEVLRASPGAKQVANERAVAAQVTERDVEPGGYRELVDEALREYAAGNYEEARSLFARAHEVFPNARTHRGLGMAEFELRNYEASIEHLEAALHATVRPLEDKLRLDTERLLARARNFVSRLTIETKPTATALLVDGSPVTNAYGAPLLLRVGDHVIEAQAHGYLSEKRRISAKGGDVQTLTIIFGLPSSPSSDAGRERRWYRSPWLWTAAGAIVAGGVTAGVLATRPNERPRAQTDTYWVMP